METLTLTSFGTTRRVAGSMGHGITRLNNTTKKEYNARPIRSTNQTTKHGRSSSVGIAGYLLTSVNVPET